MGACVFVEEQFGSSAVVKGVTAFAEKANACIKETGVYLPPNHDMGSSSINVILWFHGFYVKSVKDLIHPDDSGMDMKLRQAILKSGKDVVLIAPWLGYRDMSGGALGLGSLGEGGGSGAFLKDVLGGLARFRKTQLGGGADTVTIKNLIVAGHSAGGALMHAAAVHLGKEVNDSLRERWGFDCLYGDDYINWARATPASKKFFHFGSGSNGVHAFNLMREVYGPPKQPVPANRRPPNFNLAPVVDADFSARDDVVFQTFAQLDDWGAPGHNPYEDARVKTDPLLAVSASQYWGALAPKLVSHFQMVRYMFEPRIRQSKVL